MCGRVLSHNHIIAAMEKRSVGKRTEVSPYNFHIFITLKYSFIEIVLLLFLSVWEKQGKLIFLSLDFLQW